MKKLWIIRHAKAEAFHESNRDFNRHLRKTGREDAALVAERLKKIQPKFDAIIASASVRTAQTAEIFAEKFELDPSKIILVDALYNAEHYAYQTVVEQLDNKYENIAVVGHNPGVTDWSNKQKLAYIDDMPTTGAFGIVYKTNDWQQCSEVDKEFLGFVSPHHDI